MDRSALQRLEVLVGTWGLDIRFEGAPDTPFSGRAEIRWLLGGTFLAMTSDVSHPDAPDTYAIVAANGTFQGCAQGARSTRGCTVVGLVARA